MDQRSKDILFGTIRWLLTAITVTAVLLLVVAILLWKTEISDHHMEFYSLICIVVGGGIAGFGGGLVVKQRGLISGIVYGIIYLICILFMVFSALGHVDFASVVQPKWGICLAISALMGTFSVNLRKE